MTLSYHQKRQIADEVRGQLAPEFAALKKNVAAGTAAQQEQLDRIEAQLKRVLAMLEPQKLVKPAAVRKEAPASP